MSGDYQIAWLIPQRVIYVRAWGRHDATTIRVYSAEARKFIEQGIAPVHMLTDDRDVTMMPTLTTVQDALSFARDPNMGWIVTVGTKNRMIQMGSRLISRIFGVNYNRVETIEDAIAFLTNKDATLRWNDADQSVLAEH